MQISSLRQNICRFGNDIQLRPMEVTTTLGWVFLVWRRHLVCPVGAYLSLTSTTRCQVMVDGSMSSRANLNNNSKQKHSTFSVKRKNYLWSWRKLLFESLKKLGRWKTDRIFSMLVFLGLASRSHCFLKELL